MLIGDITKKQPSIKNRIKNVQALTSKQTLGEVLTSKLYYTLKKLDIQ